MSKLIIDPGHGGRDPGGGTNQFWKEKDFVLQISLYQFDRFKQLGVPVMLTHDSDITLEPSERTRIIRESGATHCISNHINAAGGTGDGAETIHSIYSDGRLARAIADEIRAEGQNIRRVFTRTLESNPNKDYYFMNRETGSADTVIVEYGFADSRADDVEQLQRYWKAYAEAVVRAYCNFIGHPYAAPAQSGPAQPDFAGHWAEKQIEAVKAAGVMVGDPDGSFRPDAPVTRAELAAVIAKLLER